MDLNAQGAAHAGAGAAAGDAAGAAYVDLALFVLDSPSMTDYQTHAMREAQCIFVKDEVRSAKSIFV